jgi:hypothetical protein
VTEETQREYDNWLTSVLLNVLKHLQVALSSLASELGGFDRVELDILAGDFASGKDRDKGNERRRWKGRFDELESYEWRAEN